MQDEKRNLIVHNYLLNPLVSSRELAKRLSLPKWTVARVNEKYKEIQTTARKVQTKRWSGTVNHKLRLKIVRKIQANPNISDVELAKHLNGDRFRASKHLKQQTVATNWARKLYRQVLTKPHGCISMEGETYVKAEQNIPGV